eukprot:scpid91804/ scgid18328/ 
MAEVPLIDGGHVTREKEDCIFQELTELQERLHERKYTLAEWIKFEPNEILPDSRDRVRNELLPRFWQCVHDAAVTLLVGDKLPVSTKGEATPTSNVPPSSVKHQHKQASAYTSSSRRHTNQQQATTRPARSQPARTNRPHRPSPAAAPNTANGSASANNTVQSAPFANARRQHVSPSSGNSARMHVTPPKKYQSAAYDTHSFDDFPVLGSTSTSTPRSSQTKQIQGSASKKRRIKPTTVSKDKVRDPCNQPTSNLISTPAAGNSESAFVSASKTSLREEANGTAEEQPTCRSDGGEQDWARTRSVPTTATHPLAGEANIHRIGASQNQQQQQQQ